MATSPCRCTDTVRVVRWSMDRVWCRMSHTPPRTERRRSCPPSFAVEHRGTHGPLNFTQVVSVLPPGVVDHAMDPPRRLHGERSIGRRLPDVLFSVGVTQVGSLFAGNQVATHRCNLIEGVVPLTVEHDAHQEGTLRNNGTAAAFIEPALSVHTHSGDTLCAPSSRHIVCKKMPHKNCATR